VLAKSLRDGFKIGQLGCSQNTKRETYKMKKFLASAGIAALIAVGYVEALGVLARIATS
jgi:hypothetical protein